MTEEKTSANQGSPPILRDHRFLIWFTGWGATILAVVGGGGLTLAMGWVPGPLQNSVLLASILAGLAGVGLAFAPLLIGIPCESCGRRIFEGPARPRCDGRTPLHFYCPECCVEWDTGVWWGE